MLYPLTSFWAGNGSANYLQFFPQISAAYKAYLTTLVKNRFVTYSNPLLGY